MFTPVPACNLTCVDQNVEADGPPATDPKHVLGSTIRAGDVVLIAGRTRMSRFIRFLSGSPWTHVALCVGRLEEYTQNADPTLRDPSLRDLIARACHGAKVRPTRGAARPFAHPGPFAGQVLEPCYACLPVAASTTAPRGRVKAERVKVGRFR